jgi:hypothetical protein
MGEDEVPGWNSFVRSDGMAVSRGVEGTWLVLPHDHRPPVTLCPCCKRPMKSAFAAEKVADEVYPPQ